MSEAPFPDNAWLTFAEATARWGRQTRKDQVEYIRADVSAARIADLTRQLAEAQALIYAARQERNAAEDAEKELAEELRTVKAQLAEAREVKPLEWTKWLAVDGSPEWLSRPYKIRLLSGYYVVSGWLAGTNPYPTLEAAKAAAQADYTARILSALKGPTP